MLPVSDYPKDNCQTPPHLPPAPTQQSPGCFDILLVLGLLTFSLAMITYIETQICFPTLEPTYPEFDIDFLDVSDLSYNSPNKLSANWNMNLNLKNYNPQPNMKFVFSHVKLSILYNNQTLWLTTLRDFKLEPKNVSAKLDVNLWGSSRFVEDSTPGKIQADIRTNRTVKFDVKFKASVRNRWYGLAEKLIANCKDIELIFPSPYMTIGKMMSGSKECDVDMEFFDLGPYLQSHQASSNVSHADI